MKRTLRLRSIGGPTKGQVWESDALLRAGRLASLEVVLDDGSVSRRHAEVRTTPDGTWVVQDFGSTNGTFVNGTRLTGEQPVENRDVVQFGKVAMLVEFVEATVEGPASDQLIVAASTRSPFDSDILPVTFDRDHMPQAGDQLLALLRAGHHLVHLESEDALLDSILNDCVHVLDAQRGAIVLADGGTPAEPRLKLRSLAVGTGEPKGRFHFSKRLSQQCFAAGESRLFRNMQDEKDLISVSISDGAMSSVMCVLLRTPRKKLGVLHLDRGCMQAAFTTKDLMFADALAAHVSAGIECAQLLKKQRDLFLKTITMLAQMVELRDGSTFNHTQRVTKYAGMIAAQMELPADQLELIERGAPLHDIGKVGISDDILLAPRRLTAAEFAKMQSHTTIGAAWLAGIAELHPVIPIVRNHHERWDGTGYPDRLAKHDIPLLARIVAVADSFDAMTSLRPYHDTKRDRSPAAAFAEVERQAGRQFDPDCVAAFLAIQPQIVRTMIELMPDSAVVAGPPDALSIALSEAQVTAFPDRVPAGVSATLELRPPSNAG